MQLSAVAKTFMVRGQRRAMASVTVVGGGPAGVLVAAEATHKGLHVNWIDDQHFQGGLLQQYQAVPSNTKLSHLQDLGLFESPLKELAEHCPAVRSAISSIARNVLRTPPSFNTLDPNNGWPRIADMQHLFAQCSEALGAQDAVTNIKGTATSVHRKEQQWYTYVEGSSTAVASDALVLCCGGVPRTLPELSTLTNVNDHHPHPHHQRQHGSSSSSPRVVDQRDALDQEKLANVLDMYRPKNIAIIGNSHTAALVARNLTALRFGKERGPPPPPPPPPPEIHVYSRKPVQLAEWIPTLNNYKYTANGLKGLAASYVLDERAAAHAATPNCRDARTLTTMMAMDESFWANQKYNEYDLIIPCVGFVPAPLPEIRAKTQGTAITFQYDPSTAALNVKANIYECGMSQPEYFTAPVEGLGEYPSPAVGGGEETGVEGWRGERLVSWLLFRTRAKQIVRNIVEHEKKFCI